MKTPTYLFNASHPKGKLFDASVEDMQALAEQGWVDNPAKVGAGKPVAAPAAVPEKKTESQTADTASEINDLLTIFKVEPTKLTRDELITLAKDVGADVRKNWKEATLIKAIQDTLNVND